MLNVFHMLYLFNEWRFKRKDFFFSAILELSDIFKPLTPVRNYVRKPELPPNAIHVVHTRPIYVSQLTLKINIIFSSILYLTSDLSNDYSVFYEVWKVSLYGVV